VGSAGSSFRDEIRDWGGCGSSLKKEGNIRGAGKRKRVAYTPSAGESSQERVPVIKQNQGGPEASEVRGEVRAQRGAWRLSKYHKRTGRLLVSCSVIAKNLQRAVIILRGKRGEKEGGVEKDRGALSRNVAKVEHGETLEIRKRVPKGQVSRLF